MSEMKIYVIGHKEFQLPVQNSFFVPLLVGENYGDNRLGYPTDCSGDNISNLNLRYNELTGLYWIWKNSTADIVGLCHYRRSFTPVYGKLRNLLGGKHDVCISDKWIMNKLKKYDIILHNKTFMISGNERQLCIDEKDTEEDKKNKLSKEILNIVNKTFCSVYPEDAEIYKRVMERKSAHLLNMMICRKTIMTKYCEWLFPLLFAVEKEIDSSFPNESFPRCMGLIGERLLDVWIEKEQLRVKECFSFNTERKDWKIW